VPVTPDGTYATADDCPFGQWMTTQLPDEPAVLETHELDVPDAWRLPDCESGGESANAGAAHEAMTIAAAIQRSFFTRASFA
jgi:hypothetical protein